jgi:lipopolysaccharide/colanic/teichoic acid biosynthesis glycosyltransferase
VHDDPRITRVGRFLRRAALDEFPQIIHVLRGEMTLVGPRAMSCVEHREALKEEPRFDERLQVPPGLIGIALLYLPRSVSPRRKLRYDLLYIKKASPWLDIRLLLLTVLPTLIGRWGTGHRQPETLDAGQSAPTKAG